MSKSVKGSALVIATLALIAMVTGCSARFVPEKGGAYPSSLPASPSYEPLNGSVQSSTGGGVTIDVEWILVPESPLLFELVMDTHSVDLDQYNLEKLAVLRDDVGNKYASLSWDSAPGGHHRSGTLTFPVPDSLKEKKTKYLELVIYDIASIKERVLRWEL